MREIAPILDRDHRILHDLRDLIIIEPFTKAGAHFDNFGTVPRAHDNCLIRLRRAQLKIAGQRLHGRSNCNCEGKDNQKRHAAGAKQNTLGQDLPWR